MTHKDYDPAPIAAAMLDSEFIDATKQPLPVRGMTRRTAKLWSHALHEMAAVVTGDRKMRAPRRAERFASTRDAVRAWLGNRQDGYGLTALSDPDRLRRLCFLGPTPAGASAGRWTDEADALHEVTKALRFAQETFRDASGRLDGLNAVEALAWREEGLTRADTAGRWLERQGVVVSEKRVGAVLWQAHSLAYESLRGAGVVPREALKMVGVAKAGGDLRGWKAIADFLDVSERTARRWAQVAGLPFYEVFGRVEAKSAELAEWRDEQTKPGRHVFREKLAEDVAKASGDGDDEAA
jgi:hypothetical protein